MHNISDNIKKNLLKREKAFNGYLARKASFYAFKREIKKDIKEAGIVWKYTLEQLPGKEFN
jgi:hypothetical protein